MRKCGQSKIKWASNLARRDPQTFFFTSTQQQRKLRRMEKSLYCFSCCVCAFVSLANFILSGMHMFVDTENHKRHTYNSVHTQNKKIYKNSELWTHGCEYFAHHCQTVRRARTDRIQMENHTEEKLPKMEKWLKVHVVDSAVAIASCSHHVQHTLHSSAVVF